MDEKNGKLAVPFLNNAGITAGDNVVNSFMNWKLPSELNACDDIFVMPHADPDWANHGNLLTWNANNKGAIWTGCHAGSALSNTYNPANISQQMNFLTTKVTSPGTGIILPVAGSTNYAQNSLILWGNHDDGSTSASDPYKVNELVPNTQTGVGTPADDWVSQFLGRTDEAHTNGSEQIFLPVKNAQWLSSTNIITFDTTQNNIPGNSQGTAALIAYGRAFGDNTKGLVMYEAGHNLEQTDVVNYTASPTYTTTSAGVAAQRAFFNWSFLAAQDKQVLIDDIAGVPSAGITGSTQLSSSASSSYGATLIIHGVL